MQEISGKYPQILTAVLWVSARKTYLFKLCSCRGASECFEDNLRECKDVKNLGNILNEGLLALANTLSTICSHTNNPFRLSVYVQEQQNSGSLRLVCFGFFNVLVSRNSSSCFFFVCDKRHTQGSDRFFCIEENMRIPSTDRESAGGVFRGPYPRSFYSFLLIF